MPDEPFHRRPTGRTRVPTPTPGSRGIRPLPPPADVDSMPPLDRENIARWLQNISDQLREQDERFDSDRLETERRLTLLERVVLRIETLDHKFDALSERIWKSQERDIVTAAELERMRFELEKRTVERATAAAKVAAETAAVSTAAASGEEAGKEAGNKAGKRSGRIYGLLAALLAVLLAAFEHCGPVIKKSLE